MKFSIILFVVALFIGHMSCERVVETIVRDGVVPVRDVVVPVRKVVVPGEVVRDEIVHPIDRKVRAVVVAPIHRPIIRPRPVVVAPIRPFRPVVVAPILPIRPRPVIVAPVPFRRLRRVVVPVVGPLGGIREEIVRPAIVAPVVGPMGRVREEVIRPVRPVIV